MSNIKVSELRNAIEQGREKEKVCVFGDLNVEIKQYLPIENKARLVMSAYSAISNGENIDYHLFFIGFKKMLVEEYTNINLPKNVFDAFDLIEETGLYDFVYKNIPEIEIRRVECIKDEYLKVMEERDKREHTFQNIIKQGINKFMKKVPSKEHTEEFIESLTKKEKSEK